MDITRRHHYLPQFYIKGFVNSEEMVFVYDKEENRFKKQLYSPKRIFFEWNRNALLIDGKEDDFIEKLYNKVETRHSISYNKIISNPDFSKITIEDINILILLISFTHWRLPVNDLNAKELILSTTRKDLYLKIMNRLTGEEVEDSIFDEIKKREGFVELYKLIKPIFEFLKLDKTNCYEHWKIYGAISDVRLHLLGDNPIIFRNQSNKNILENDLIFPLSSRAFIFHNKGNYLKVLQPELTVMIDIMVFLQSQRYVIGPNKEYLKAIQIKSQEYNSEAKIEDLRNEIFSIFE